MKRDLLANGDFIDKHPFLSDLTINDMSMVDEQSEDGGT
jgi:hypothetical protein